MLACLCSPAFCHLSQWQRAASLCAHKHVYLSKCFPASAHVCVHACLCTCTHGDQSGPLGWLEQSCSQPAPKDGHRACEASQVWDLGFCQPMGVTFCLSLFMVCTWQFLSTQHICSKFSCLSILSLFTLGLSPRALTQASWAPGFLTGSLWRGL